MRSYRMCIRLIVGMMFVTLTAVAAVAQQRTDFGTLSIQVRPPEADVFIDGERWTGSETTGALQVQLSPGTHYVEVRSPGRQTFARQVTIRAGETTPLNVSLIQGEGAEPTIAPPSTVPRPPAPSSNVVRATASEDGFVIAPDYRVTDLNHHTGQLVGAYGGYVFGGQALIGAGGYWQADSTDGTHIAYGGPVFEWRMFPDRTIGFNLHGLIGGGWRYADHGYYGDVRFDHDGPQVDPRHGAPYAMPYGWDDQSFFVAEPEAQVVVRFGSAIRLQGGVGYRATSADNLSGVSGSVSVQFGR